MESISRQPRPFWTVLDYFYPELLAIWYSMVCLKLESRDSHCRPKILKNPDQKLGTADIQCIALQTLFVCCMHVADALSYTTAHFLWTYDLFLTWRLNWETQILAIFTRKTSQKHYFHLHCGEFSSNPWKTCDYIFSCSICMINYVKKQEMGWWRLQSCRSDCHIISTIYYVYE